MAEQVHLAISEAQFDDLTKIPWSTAMIITIGIAAQQGINNDVLSKEFQIRQNGFFAPSEEMIQ